MFESVNHSTQTMKSNNPESSFGGIRFVKVVRPSFNAWTDPRDESNRSRADMPSRAAPEPFKNDIPRLRNVAIKFSIHEETGKIMIQIVDRDSNEVIREIPSDGGLERSKRPRTSVGGLIDWIA
jgi:FlaG protein